MHTSHTLFAILVLALTSSCTGMRTLADPTLVMQTQGGTELGVSTDYGVVFLGRTAHSGPLELTAWFGDGANIEKTVIEPVGGGVFTAETEIRLPVVAMDFDDPKPGAKLLVFGRDEKGAWSEPVTVENEPRILGVVTTIPPRLRGAETQIGAGVYSTPPDGDTRMKRLVGLVSGTVKLRGAGGEREYLAVVGPEDLWRIVAHRRDPGHRRRWIYREDIL